MNATYDELRTKAHQASRGGNWAAVVEITNYLSSSPARMTIAVSSTGPIKSQSRGSEFRGVACQFHDGAGMYDTPQGPAIVPTADSNELPF